MFNKIIGAVVATTMLASTGFLCARTIVGNNAIFAYRPSRKRLKHAQTQRLAQVWAYLLRRAHADEYLHIAINWIARYSGDLLVLHRWK
jgi:hypothetical protein